MILPGFKTSTTTKSLVLDAAVKLVFSNLEATYDRVTLTDLATISSGGTPLRNDSSFYGGDIPWAKIGDVTASKKWIYSTQECITEEALRNSSAKLFPKGTVLFSMYGSIGKTAITTVPMATNQAILGLEPRSGINSEYLYYCLINARLALFSDAKGTSQMNINGGMVKSLRVPIPPTEIANSIVQFLSSIEEGTEIYKIENLPTYLLDIRRIVARIEELAARIEEAREMRRRAVEESEALFNKILQKVFERFTGETIAIGEVFKVTTGGTPSRANPLFWGGDIKWVSSGEVAFCRIKNTLETITQLGVENSNAHLYPPNTVLIAMIGQGKTRGQCAILDCNATTNQNIAAIHVYETQHSPEFVYWWLYSRYAESRSAEIGTAQPALSGTRVKQMPIPLPPIREQIIAVTYLNSLKSKLDALRRHQSETAAALDALLPAVLERAFRGEL